MPDSPPLGTPIPISGSYEGTTRDLVKRVQEARLVPLAKETQATFTAFYERYARYVTTIVARQLEPLPDRGGIAEVVHDTFLSFFHSCHRFDADLAPTDEACDRNLRAYLAALANWRAKDAKAFQRSFGASAVDPSALAEFDPKLVVDPDRSRIPPPEPGHVQRVAEWLASLPTREADILRTYFTDDHLGQQTKRLPEGIAQALASKYATTTSNIRHIKLRLVRELREKISAHE